MQQLLPRPQCLVSRHLVRDVHELGSHVTMGRIIEEVVVRDLQPQPRTVTALMTQPDSIALAGPGEHLHPALDGPLAVVRMDELERPLTQHLVRRPAKHLGRRLVDGNEHRELALMRGREARYDSGPVRKSVEHIQRGIVFGEKHHDEDAMMLSNIEEVQVRRTAWTVRELNRRGAAPVFRARSQVLSITSTSRGATRCRAERPARSLWPFSGTEAGIGRRRPSAPTADTTASGCWSSSAVSARSSAGASIGAAWSTLSCSSATGNGLSTAP